MNNTTIRTPAKDPGCLHAWQMIPRFIGLDIRMAKRKRQLRLGTSELIKLVPEAYRIPDSTIAQQATQLVREISDDMLLNHCYRTYFLAALLLTRMALHLTEKYFI